MKQRFVEILKSTKFYNAMREYFYSTKINDYQGQLLGEVEANETIKQLIYNKKPFMISRLGSTELSVLRSFREGKEYNEKQNETIRSLSGFFPVNKSSLNKFSQLYFKSITNIDLLGIWFNPFEDVIANEVCPTARLTKLRSLEPYFSLSPWSEALKGKNVLVIHPFTESIKQQYLRRELLFENSNVLPEFNLITYTAVQSLGGINPEYDSWFDALAGMQHDISSLDFDVAIVGAGAYGLPLASFIKNMGKSAIHLGGATQLLFGIYGRRWEENPNFINFINEYWVRPLENEKPKSASNVENGCYW
jgi:hypothetical protein